jgi:DNA-binding PadR family transcriptional regulator
MFFVALGDEPAYGYELAARFRKMTGGHMKVSYGTIYPFLRRMERRGIIRSRKDGKTGRVYYELTQSGIDAKKDVMKRMKEYQNEMEEKLLGVLSMHAAVFGQKSLTQLLKQSAQIGKLNHPIVDPS